MADNVTPYEVLMAPFTVWVAPVGTAVPLIDTAEGSFNAAWDKLGALGNRSMDDAVVTVTHEQDISQWIPGGSTGPVKVGRNTEGLLVAFNLADITLEMYAVALNDGTVTDTPASSGVAGFRSVDLYRGLEVAQHALLIRGASPYGDAWNMQYSIPVCYMSGSPAVQPQKNSPALLAFSFVALEDLNAASASKRFGVLLAQDATAI